MTLHLNRRPLAAAKRLLPIFREHIEPFEHAIAESASCRKGCSACCYQYVASTLAEGALIAARVLEDDVLRADLPAFRRKLEWDVIVASRLSGKGIREEWFRLKRPCAFLNTGDGTCRIYDVRPVACRTYAVVSSAEWCSLERAGHPVAYVDARRVAEAVWPAIGRATKEAIPSESNTLATMVLAGFELLTRTPRDFARWYHEQNFVDGLRFLDGSTT